MKISIVSREFMKPSSPTPSHLKDFKLSYLDQLIPPSYVPLILYYSDDQTSNIVTQCDMSRRLKESLSETLTKFYPLAGRMTKDQSSVDCSDQGAYYLEARVDSQLSEIIRAPEVEILDRFLPHGGVGMVRVVEEQLAVQVNMFRCGGIAIGICVNHRLADICTLGSFIKAWAATSRGDMISSSSVFLPPVFESVSLFPPTILDSSPNSTVQTQTVAVGRTVSKRFVFTASAIAALKGKVVSDSAIKNPTRVEVVSALLWKCGILSKTGFNKREKTWAALQVVNLRGRMVPVPLKEHSFGNIFQMARAITTDGESTELGCLVAKFRAAVGTIDSEYIQKLLGENGFEIVKSKFAEMGKMMYKGDVELFTFTSWCRFANIYEADFGWGKPSWVSRASSASKNCVYLMDSTMNEGGIEAWVVMDEQDMATFEQLFLASKPY